MLAGDPNGPQLLAGFHGAAVVGCALAMLGGLSAWLLISPK